MSSKGNPRRKTKKKRFYTGSKAFDSSCRNHGSCSYCANGRKFKHKKRAQTSENI